MLRSLRSAGLALILAVASLLAVPSAQAVSVIAPGREAQVLQVVVDAAAASGLERPAGVSIDQGAVTISLPPAATVRLDAASAPHLDCPACSTARSQTLARFAQTTRIGLRGLEPPLWVQRDEPPPPPSSRARRRVGRSTRAAQP